MPRINFTLTRFSMSAERLEQLPKGLGQEVAFAGRSNVGKSSLINKITSLKSLAKKSKQPGKTRHLNLFTVGNPSLRLVDLPGYGYARLSKQEAENISQRMHQYLLKRYPLTAVVLCIDMRRGLLPIDEGFLALVQSRVRPTQILILANKCDKLSQSQQGAAQNRLLASLTQKLNGAWRLMAVSAQHEIGIPEARAVLADLLTADEGKLPQGPVPLKAQ